MANWKQKEMIYAHNLLISRNDTEKKTRIDDGEQTAATTNDRDGQSKIYEQGLSLWAVG